MISPDVWKTIAECLKDILMALEKNERVDLNEKREMVQTKSHRKNFDSFNSNID
ncbi:hypothetical protein [Enterococcus raffinosus]|uniref:hypothetical protein n=1 Tax=Enterococcus raffinosus TaxID=71452 RepID=UPI002891072C|nr:hypothetical protein [Enterococcus raffinosus]MDT2525771.1 hypothetical protein [Enterococcus raffinosus]